MQGRHRWEPPVAILCALLSFVPLVRVPAAFVLLCLLPGAAICRHRLGETSIPRILILGSLLSLCVVPAVCIPVSLATGRPIALVAVLLAAAVTCAASLRPAPSRKPQPLSVMARAHLAFIAALAIVLQVAMSFAQYPSPETIRWRGLPDLMFFVGINDQLTLHTPPLDPENGAALLVHNWIYHFHFAMVQLVSGLDIQVVQRVVSAWMALVLLGLVYLICHDVLARPLAGLLACLLLMASGEVRWIVRSIIHLAVDLSPMPWAHSPFGLTLLFGWYNLAPLAAGLGAWYWIERHRAAGRPADLAASVAMCTAMAFFHPVFYGVFMIGFTLWLASLWLREGPRPIWLVYLMTPVPFFVLYKLPYYGTSMPPQVVHGAFSLSALHTHVTDLAMSCGIYFALGAVAILWRPVATGPLLWIAGSSLALRLFASAPNPHWFNDLLYLMLAMASGLALARLMKASALAGLALASLSLLVGGVAFTRHVNSALSLGHTYTAGEIAAADWIRRNTGADDLVAILPNSTSSYTVLGLGSRRLVHGWTGHLLDFHDYARQQEVDVREMFTTTDAERAAELAIRLKVDWIYIGRFEADTLGRAGPSGECFPTVFAAEGVEVRAFTCRQRLRGALLVSRAGLEPATL